MPTIFAPELFTPKGKVCVKSHDEYLRNNAGICSAILADALDVTERFVISRQRKLGLAIHDLRSSSLLKILNDRAA